MNSKQISRDSNRSNVASLLLCCADKTGIIALLTDFFSQRNLNISRHVVYTNDGQFFLRLEWDLNDLWEDEASFSEEFASFVSDHNVIFDVRFMNRKQSIGLFVSKQSHALIDTLNKAESNYFPDVDISFIVANDQQMRGAADRHGIPFFFIPTDTNALEYEKRQLEVIHRYKPDYIGLAQYKVLISANFISRAECPIIDIRRSFLSANTDQESYRSAFDRGVKLIGATSSFVTADLDSGPIIDQDVVRVLACASVDDMVALGKEVEQKVFARAMLKVLQHKVIVHKNRTVVFD